MWSAIFEAMTKHDDEESETAFLKDWNCWHRSRIDELKAPYGWLSQTGLYWFNELNQYRVHVPGVPGRWQLTADKVTYYTNFADRKQVQSQTIQLLASHMSV